MNLNYHKEEESMVDHSRLIKSVKNFSVSFWGQPIKGHHSISEHTPVPAYFGHQNIIAPISQKCLIGQNMAGLRSEGERVVLTGCAGRVG